MKTSQEIILSEVTEVLREMCDLKETDISLETNPIEALALDSGHGIPFAIEMETRLGIKIPDDINPFVEDKPTRKTRTVKEIVSVLMSLKKNQEKNDD